MYPSARHEDFLVEELADEILVYDLHRNKAHCLNRTAAFVWRRCDGQTSVADIAALLPAELGLPAEEDIVLLALEQLERIKLMREPLALSRADRSVSRRKLLQRLGVAGGVGLLLPVVSSIVVPTPAMAASPMQVDEGGCGWVGPVAGGPKTECLIKDSSRCTSGKCRSRSDGNLAICGCV
jgi:hypothetical protein